AAVTMRRVAAELDVEAMSLYHHIPSKDSLLDGLVEALVTEIARSAPARTPGEEWRSALGSRCLSARQVVMRHRWAPELIGSRTQVPAGLVTEYEAVLAIMIDGGLGYHLAHRGLHALGSM